VEGYEPRINSTINITATKIWDVAEETTDTEKVETADVADNADNANDVDDANDAEETADAKVTKPESITLTLLKNGEKAISKTVTEADGWSCTFENLDKYDDDGNEITYTVEEEGADASNITVTTEDGYVITITNAHDVSQIADTGVHIDYLPYVLIFAIAGGLSILMVICRAKRRKRYL
jgi:hypothetical protein